MAAMTLRRGSFPVSNAYTVCGRHHSLVNETRPIDSRPVPDNWTPDRIVGHVGYQREEILTAYFGLIGRIFKKPATVVTVYSATDDAAFKNC
jgi:hypothetical protein